VKDPQDPGPVSSHPVRDTGDLDTSALNESECRADNDAAAQQDCYKLICLRFAVSCSQSLRNQKFIFPTQGEGNRYFYKTCSYESTVISQIFLGTFYSF
jgi:hypothetical protein